MLSVSTIPAGCYIIANCEHSRESGGLLGNDRDREGHETVVSE